MKEYLSLSLTGGGSNVRVRAGEGSGEEKNGGDFVHMSGVCSGGFRGEPCGQDHPHLVVTWCSGS